MAVDCGSRSLDEVRRLVPGWWETACLDGDGGDKEQAEVGAVNGMMEAIEEFPGWTVEVREGMPKYGFEMCGHRWLSGLDDCLRQIGSGMAYPSMAGRCGDVPGVVFASALGRAELLRRWAEGEATADLPLGERYAQWLGEPTPDKAEAARTLAELVSLGKGRSTEEWAYSLRDREMGPVLRTLIEDGLLHDLPSSWCGFRFVERMDGMVRAIGGDTDGLVYARRGCNTQLSLVHREDPCRYEITRGYLWGLHAALCGRDEAWLIEAKPSCAPAARHALRSVAPCPAPPEVACWLIASMLVATKLWCQTTLSRTPAEEIPAHWEDLPDVREVTA